MVPLVGLNGDKPYLPTLENIQTGRYPLSRNLYFYVNREPGKPLPPAVQAFLEFVLSGKGQEISKGYGAAPLSPALTVTEQAKLQ
jgi:phosphate transport system substrate-binding protein